MLPVHEVEQQESARERWRATIVKKLRSVVMSKEGPMRMIIVQYQNTVVVTHIV